MYTCGMGAKFFCNIIPVLLNCGGCFAYKPAPDAIKYLMGKYAMTAEDAVMVGDRDCDLGSARNAGIGTMHYACAAVPETLQADYRIESYAEMLKFL